MSTKMVHFTVWNLRCLISWILMCGNSWCGRVSKFTRHYIDWLFFVVEYIKILIYGQWHDLWCYLRIEVWAAVFLNIRSSVLNKCDFWKNNYDASCDLIEGNQSRNHTQPRSVCGCPSHFMIDSRWMIQPVSHCSFWSPFWGLWPDFVFKYVDKCHPYFPGILCVMRQWVCVLSGC
jgi:hypothetical protein